MFAFKALWFLLLTLIGRSTGTDNELKLNMVGFTQTPTVDDNNINKETNIRGYTLRSDRSDNITLNIELLPYANLSGQPLCDNTDLADIVQCKFVQNNGEGKESTHLKAVISRRPNDTVETRVGVFTVYAENGPRNATATMIVHHAEAYVKPIVRTKTVNINDIGVTLGVDVIDVDEESVRWTKDGIDNTEWNGLTEILFETITLADAGVYECYGDGRRNEGKHAFMQLIVRECPHNKWSPPDCNMDCKVCYNGGVCDTYIGTCICPSGFIGTNCEISSGGNRFGRDGDVPCQRGNDDGCKGKLICPPMPQGCACQAGWKGLDCNTGCEAGKYGADCLQVCHCNDDECDPSEGCNKEATCHPCYEGERCLSISSVSCNSCDDCCHFQSYCFVENKVSWSDAEAECGKLDNGHLVSIHSGEENLFVMDIIRIKATDNNDHHTWIGLTYSDNDQPTWSDGTQYGGYSYGMNDNNNTNNNNNKCVAYHKDDKWEKKDCTDDYAYICKHRAGTGNVF